MRHGHADPNLTYAVELVAAMGLNAKGEKISTGKPVPSFGAGADGDRRSCFMIILANRCSFSSRIGVDRSQGCRSFILMVNHNFIKTNIFP